MDQHCDRCYAPLAIPHTHVRVETPTSGAVRTLDLCEACADSLHAWMEAIRHAP